MRSQGMRHHDTREWGCPHMRSKRRRWGRSPKQQTPVSIGLWRVEIPVAVETEAQRGQAVLKHWKFRLAKGVYRAWFEDPQMMVVCVKQCSDVHMSGKRLRVDRVTGEVIEIPKYEPSAAAAIPSLNGPTAPCVKQPPKPYARFAPKGCAG